MIRQKITWFITQQWINIWYNNKIRLSTGRKKTFCRIVQCWCSCLAIVSHHCCGVIDVQVFVTSQLVWKQIVVQYAIWTSVTWKLKTSSEHTRCLKGSRRHLVSKCWNENIYIFIDFGFLNEVEWVGVIVRIYSEVIELLCIKTISDTNYYSKQRQQKLELELSNLNINSRHELIFKLDCPVPTNSWHNNLNSTDVWLKALEQVDLEFRLFC